jgi:hypothetical protein
MSKNMEFLRGINFHLQIKLKNNKNLHSQNIQNYRVQKYFISKILDSTSPLKFVYKVINL